MLMGAWWESTRLVAGRGFREIVTSRVFKLVSGLLLLLSVAGVVLPQVLGGGRTTYTLATRGTPPAALVKALDAAGKAGAFSVEYARLTDTDAVRRAVRDGDASVGLAGDTLYTTDNGRTFAAVVAQTAVVLQTARELVAAGLAPAQIATLEKIRPPRQVAVGRAEDQGRKAVGFAVGVVLYLALTLAGSSIATTVAMEKSTRISEVILAVLRPSQQLVGTVLAVGATTLLQLLVLAAPLAASVLVTDNLGVPALAAADIAVALVWFGLGFLLYAFLFAAAAALVDRVTQVSAAIQPVVAILLAAYLVAIAVVAPDPRSAWSLAASLFPLTAPLAMPIRWASGTVPVYQLVLSLLLSGATAVLLISAASSIYRRALVITGHRVSLREALGGRPREPSPRRS